jgi:hypothetical protein
VMELDFDDSVVRGLCRYVRLVTQALGLRGECSYVQADGPTSAYIALDGRLRHFADRDVALLWDENQGWSAAIETHSGEDLLVVAYLGQELLPPPETVAAWTRELFHPHRDLAPVTHLDERPDPANVDRLRQRLAAYVDPELVWTSGHRTRGADGESLSIG